MKHYRETAYLFLRLTLGLMFLFFGVGKFMKGLDAVSSGMVERFSSSPLPPILVESFAYVLPFLEVAIGALLLMGLFTRLALIASALLMLALTFGTVMEPDPATVASNVNYALIIFVLLWLSDHDRYSLDYLRGGDRSEL